MGELLRQRVRVTFDVDVVVNDLTPEEFAEATKQDAEDEDNWRLEWVQRQMRLFHSVLSQKDSVNAFVEAEDRQALFMFFDQEGLDIQADEIKEEILLAHAKQMNSDDAEFFDRVHRKESFHTNTEILWDRVRGEVVSDSWVVAETKEVEVPTPLEVQPELLQLNHKARRAALQKPKKRRK